MKIHIERLGPLSEADIELGNLTLVFGENNTGKTWATSLISGLFYFWREWWIASGGMTWPESQTLLEQGSLVLKDEDVINRAPEFLEGLSRYYAAWNAHHVLGVPESMVGKLDFSIEVSKQEIVPISPSEPVTRAIDLGNNTILYVRRETDSTVFSLVTQDREAFLNTAPEIILSDQIWRVVREFVFGNLMSRPFVFTAERTGVALFAGSVIRISADESVKKLAKSLLEKSKPHLNQDYKKEPDIFSNYPEMLRREILFQSRLSQFRPMEKGFIPTNYPDLIPAFELIAGGNYSVSEQGKVSFHPDTQPTEPDNKTATELGLAESSSSVRALESLYLYILHVAKPGDIIFIDEPESNLHPRNQRLLARFLARLVKTGVKVFITTHSDYIVREFNTLIMLDNAVKIFPGLPAELGYENSELLACSDVKVHEINAEPKGNSQRLVLKPIEVSKEYGMVVQGFDKEIIEMNDIQSRIIFQTMDGSEEK